MEKIVRAVREGGFAEEHTRRKCFFFVLHPPDGRHHRVSYFQFWCGGWSQPKTSILLSLAPTSSRASDVSGESLLVLENRFSLQPFKHYYRATCDNVAYLLPVIANHREVVQRWPSSRHIVMWDASHKTMLIILIHLAMVVDENFSITLHSCLRLFRLKYGCDIELRIWKRKQLSFFNKVKSFVNNPVSVSAANAGVNDYTCEFLPVEY